MPVAANSSVAWIIESEHFGWHAGEGVPFLEDLSTELTIQDVMADNQAAVFQLNHGSSINFGYSESAYWLKLPVTNRLKETVKLILSFDYSLVDEVDFYWVQQGQVSQQRSLGDSRPLQPSVYDVPHYIDEFKLRPDQNVVLYIRMRSASSLSAPISISSESAFVSKVAQFRNIEGAFYGLALGLLCYNLFLMVMLRERIYLEYVLFVAAHVFFQLFITGYGKFLFPENEFVYERGVYIFGVVSGMLLFQFSRSYLHTAKQSPKVDKFMRFYLLFCFGMLILESTASIQLTNKVNAAVVFFGCVFLFVIGFIRVFSGYKSARFFLVGQGAVLASVMFTALSSRQVISGYEFAPLVMKLGTVVELLFFSVGLADRINRFKEKETSLAEEAAKANAENVARKRYIDQINNINHELAVAVKSRSEFLANMSHEIRTPMNGILGMLELIDDSKLDLVERNYIAIARRSGNTLLDLINDILDLSKIEADKLELELAGVPIRELAEDLQHLYQQQIQDKGITLQVKLDEALPECILGDRTRLWQILTNLTSNAIKFTSKGQVSIVLSVMEEESGKQLRVAVKDTGIGIAKEKQDKIFESFTQADGSTTREYGGTGLGLTISKKLIERIGGELQLESTKGVGSTFFFSIPLQAAERVQTKSKLNAVECFVDYAKLSVLLVEDNVVNQKVAQGMLKKLGVEDICVADNGADAVVALERERFDVVFMDVQMPVMDGYAATRKIRDDERQFARDHQLIIAMTAHSMEGDKDLCIEAGMDDYIAKPIKKASLESVFELHLSAGGREDLEGQQLA
ncbi:MAG: ATP-binding protein [Pseudomonadales bacterium]|nr:ATP-binding protein [Pseudomonadales bacterium]